MNNFNIPHEILYNFAPEDDIFEYQNGDKWINFAANIQINNKQKK